MPTWRLIGCAKERDLNLKGQDALLLEERDRVSSMLCRSIRGSTDDAFLRSRQYAAHPGEKRN